MYVCMLYNTDCTCIVYKTNSRQFQTLGQETCESVTCSKCVITVVTVRIVVVVNTNSLCRVSRFGIMFSKLGKDLLMRIMRRR